jgi:hypothetical protein
MPRLSTLIVGLIGTLNLVNGLANLFFEEAKRMSAEVMGIESLQALDAIALGSASVGWVLLYSIPVCNVRFCFKVPACS